MPSMNEIERAIIHFDGASQAAGKVKAAEPDTAPICDNIVAMNNIAIAALREKAERETWSCNRCENGSKNYESDCYCRLCGRRLDKEENDG